MPVTGAVTKWRVWLIEDQSSKIQSCVCGGYKGEGDCQAFISPSVTQPLINNPL